MALEIGLIDNLGNMEDAVKRAAELADLEDYKTFYPSLPLGWRDQILKQLFSKIKGIFKSRIGNKDLIKRSFELANDLETYNDPKGIYLKCLDCLIY
jgi:protease-4